MSKVKNYLNSIGPSLTALKSSILAILCGLLIASIIMMMSGANPLLALMSLLIGGFNKFYIRTTLVNLAIYGMAGLAIAVAFKSGVFNIGVTGQMMLGGAMAAFLGIATTINIHLHFLAIIICVVVAGATGSLVAVFAGLLKVFFKVHEVVSTILLNWVIYYFIKFLFSPSTKSLVHKPSTVNSSPIHNVWRLLIHNNGLGSGWIIGCIILAIALVIIYFVINLSKLGFGFRMLGASANASRYAGLDIKKNIVVSMAISGALAGIAGAILYSGYTGFIPNFQTFPQFGFIAIAIALLGFNNPIGVVFAALFYSAMKSGGSYAQAVAGVNQSVMQLTIGTIIYFAAISALFMKFKPWKYLQKFYFKKFNNNFNTTYKKYQSDTKGLKAKYQTILKESKELFQENRHKGFALIKEAQLNIQEIKKTINYKDANFEDKEAQILKLKRDLNDDLKEMGYSKFSESKKIFNHNLKMLKQTFELTLQEKFKSYKLKNKKGALSK